MLHQILCALLGKTGSLIKNYQKQITVDPSINFISKPEIQVINQIVKPGFYYHQITQLIKVEHSVSNIRVIQVKSPSLYRKAVYSGVNITLQEYVDLVLGIQAEFLRNRHFTFANLKAELRPFQLVLKEVWQILQRIHTQNYRGGTVINFLYQKFENANINLRHWLENMLKQAIKVFLNQVNAWVLYGQIVDTNGEFFIHKVMTDSSQKFKYSHISNKSRSNSIQITDWEMYTLEEFMIPKCLIGLETAGKILFIGKSIQILRSANKISSIPSQQILEKVQQTIKINNETIGQNAYGFSQVHYEGAIQQIRLIVAQQMIDFIIKEKNLIKELEKLNSYYLMFKGDFYHHFFQEAKGIQSIAQKQKAQKKINEVYLPNTFIRLSDQQDDMKRLFFQIKTMGFSFNSFKNFVNLCPVGNINLIQNKAVRFNCSGSAMWNRTKQVIQNNFTMVYSFNFRKLQQQMHSANKTHKSKEPTYLNVILQNSRQVSTGSSSMNYGNENYSAAYLNRINQYIGVKVGFEYSEKQKNYVSSMLIVCRDVRKNQKEQLLGISVPKNINFLDQKQYTVKLHYSNEFLKAQLTGGNGEKTESKIDSFRISNYLDLEMGRSFVGFVSTLNQAEYAIDLTQWEMICKPTSFYNSHWNDLSMNFRINWPVNLIITQDLLESYSRIHKFLFPIRQLQIDIQSIWFQIPRMIKAEQRINQEQLRELKSFERNLASLRSQISLVINNFWAYFHTDIAQVLWAKLVKNLQKERDFEDVISYVNKYVKSIQIMFFFNVPKIQRKINQLIEKAKGFTIFFHNLVNQSYIDGDVYTDLETIGMEFNEKLSEFCNILKDLSKINTSQHLYHITSRMESCLNPMNNFKGI